MDNPEYTAMIMIENIEEKINHFNNSNLNIIFSMKYLIQILNEKEDTLIFENCKHCEEIKK
jgi:hypothetical protein